MLLTVADIEARTGQTYEDERLTQVETYVIDVTGLIEDFLDISYATSTPPAALKLIAAREVMRYLNTDPGITSDHIGELSTGYQGGIDVLSPQTEAALRRYRTRLKGRRGIGSIQLISRYVCDEPTTEEPAP